MRRLLTILFLSISIASFGRRLVPYNPGGDVCWFGSENGKGTYCDAGTDFHGGDTIVLHNGWVNTFTLGKCSGSIGDSIVIMADDAFPYTQYKGQGVRLDSVQYVKITGATVPGEYYGLYFEGAFAGINIQGGTRHFNVERFDVYKSGYIFQCKQDFYFCDYGRNFPAYRIGHGRIHDFRGKNINQDGGYGGNTNPHGDSVDCDGDGHMDYLAQPVLLEDIWIYNGILDSLNRTGLQLGLCHGGKIFNNVITRCGYEYNNAQGAGIIIGGTSEGIEVYNNTVDHTWLPGIEVLGRGRNIVRNNIVKHSGWLPIDTTQTDMDSLKTALDIRIHNTESGVWNTTPTTKLLDSNGMIINNFVSALNIYVQPDFNYYGGKIGEGPIVNDSVSTVIRDNIVGICINPIDPFTDDWRLAPETIQIGYKNYNKNPFSYFNYNCGNLQLDEVTPAGISADGQHYFTNCSALDNNPLKKRIFSGYIRSGVKGKIITGIKRKTF